MGKFADFKKMVEQHNDGDVGDLLENSLSTLSRKCASFVLESQMNLTVL